MILDQGRERTHRNGLAKHFGSVVQRLTRRVNAAGSAYRGHWNCDVIGRRCGHTPGQVQEHGPTSHSRHREGTQVQDRPESRGDVDLQAGNAVRPCLADLEDVSPRVIRQC